MVRFLCWLKVDSIETSVSQALIDMEINHEEFNAIIREKQKYKRMKENVRNVNEKQENMRLKVLIQKKKKIIIIKSKKIKK